MSSNAIGEVPILITGDYSGLQDDFDAAAALASDAGNEIAAGFSQGAGLADEAIAGIGQSFQEASDEVNSGSVQLVDASETIGGALQETMSAAQESTFALTDLSQSATAYADVIGDAETGSESLSGALGDVSTAAEDSTAGMGDAESSVKEFGSATEEAEGPLGAFGEQLEHVGEIFLEWTALDDISEIVKSTAEGMVEASDSVERTSISLQALGESADQTAETINQLEELAANDALSFPQLQQAAVRMTAILGTGADVVSLMGDLANAAAVMGTNIEDVSSSFERIAASSTLSDRMLVSLGLTVNSLAEALGTTADQLKGSDGLWAQMDQTQHIEALQQALQKFQGVAEDVAQNTISGAWKSAGVEWEKILQDMGDVLSPFLIAIGKLVDLILGPLAGAMTALAGFLGLHTQASTQAADATDKLSSSAATAAGSTQTLGTAAAGATRDVQAFATAHIQSASSVQNHYQEIQKAQAVLASYGIQTTAEVDGLVQEKGAHNEAEAAIIKARDTLEAFGITTVGVTGDIVANSSAAKDLHEIYTTHGVLLPEVTQATSDYTQQVLNSSAAMFGNDNALQDQAAAVARNQEGIDSLSAAMDPWITSLKQAGDQEEYDSNQLATMTDAHKAITDPTLLAADAIAKAAQAAMDEAHSLDDSSTAATSAADEYAAATQQFYDIASAGNDAAASAKSMGDEITEAAEQSDTAGGQMGNSLGSALDSIITGTNSAGDAFLKFGESLLKSATEVLTNALNPLSSALGGIKDQISGLFGGGEGSIGSIGSGIEGIGSSILGSVTGILGGAIPDIVSALGGSHTDNVLGQIEHNTRYFQIEFEQNVPHMWTDSMASSLASIDNHIGQMVGQGTTGSSGFELTVGTTTASGKEVSISAPITINGSNDPATVAQQVAQYLMSVSAKFQS